MLTRIKSDLDLLTGALTSTSIIFTETSYDFRNKHDYFFL